MKYNSKKKKFCVKLKINSYSQININIFNNKSIIMVETLIPQKDKHYLKNVHLILIFSTYPLSFV